MLPLIITRQEGEVVTLPLPDGREVLITLLDVRPGVIKFGVVAPQDVPVHREEVQRGYRKADET